MKKPTFEILYNFLCENYLNSTQFSLQEITDNLGKKGSSVKTYLTKKLLNVYVSKINSDTYLVEKFGNVTRDFFIDYMSQKSLEVRDAKKEYYQRLKERAEQSFFLSLEIYNRVTLLSKMF